MSVPVPVTIVQPKFRWPTFVGVILQYFFGGWLIMLLVPVVAPVHLDYWQAVAAYLLVKMVGATNHELWSKSYESWKSGH